MDDPEDLRRGRNNYKTQCMSCSLLQNVSIKWLTFFTFILVIALPIAQNYIYIALRPNAHELYDLIHVIVQHTIGDDIWSGEQKAEVFGLVMLMPLIGGILICLFILLWDAWKRDNRVIIIAILCNALFGFLMNSFTMSPLPEMDSELGGDLEIVKKIFGVSTGDGIPYYPTYLGYYTIFFAHTFLSKGRSCSWLMRIVSTITIVHGVIFYSTTRTVATASLVLLIPVWWFVSKEYAQNHVAPIRLSDHAYSINHKHNGTGPDTAFESDEENPNAVYEIGNELEINDNDVENL